MSEYAGSSFVHWLHQTQDCPHFPKRVDNLGHSYSLETKPFWFTTSLTFSQAASILPRTPSFGLHQRTCSSVPSVLEFPGAGSPGPCQNRAVKHRALAQQVNHQHTLWDMTEGRGFTQGRGGCGSRRKRSDAQMQLGWTAELPASLTNHGHELWPTLDNERRMDMAIHEFGVFINNTLPVWYHPAGRHRN